MWLINANKTEVCKHRKNENPILESPSKNSEEPNQVYKQLNEITKSAYVKSIHVCVNYTRKHKKIPSICPMIFILQQKNKKKNKKTKKKQKKIKKTKKAKILIQNNKKNL